MLNNIRLYINKHKLLDYSNAPVLVGLSGGADSVALLSVLSKLGYNCIALHCNFHLRGDESMRDEDFARKTAEKLNVPFVKIDFDTVEFAKEKHLSIEMAARELRYEWFEAQRKELKAQAIAVAHHRDDNAETLLLNIVRGSGIRGMRGMLPKNNNIIRPLLSCSREEILQWLKKESLDYITDSSNLSDEYARNFIRLNIMPMLEKINPAAKQNIARTAENLSAAEALYMNVVEEVREKAWDKYRLRLDTNIIMKYPAYETIIFELLQPFGFSRIVCSNICSCLEKEPGKCFKSKNWTLVTASGYLQLNENKDESEAETIYPVNLEPEKGIAAINAPINLEFSIETVESIANFEIVKDKSIAYFDLDKIGSELNIRHWNHGDWFVPFGMKGKKKLSDYFSDKKLNRIQKENIWLLVSGEDILWIIGERADNRFRITEKTRNILTVKLLEKH